MLIYRRTFLMAGLGAVGFGLAGCMDTAAANLTVSARGLAGMNPGPDGGDRPVTLQILQMTGSSAFDGTDYITLQNPSLALGSELIKADQLVLAGGGTASKIIVIQPGTTVIGVVGGFRSPTGKTVRSKIAAPPSDSGLIIMVGPGGISLTSA